MENLKLKNELFQRLDKFAAEYVTEPPAWVRKAPALALELPALTADPALCSPAPLAEEPLGSLLPSLSAGGVYVKPECFLQPLGGADLCVICK